MNMRAIIKHVKGGRWVLSIPSEGQSPSCDYSERIIFGGYVGQTEYHGEAKVWKLAEPIPHIEVDNSML